MSLLFACGRATLLFPFKVAQAIWKTAWWALSLPLIFLQWLLRHWVWTTIVLVGLGVLRAHHHGTAINVVTALVVAIAVLLCLGREEPKKKAA